MDHECPRNGCTRQVPEHMLMCRSDWYRVPRPLRDAVWATWRNGAGAGSPEHRPDHRGDQGGEPVNSAKTYEQARRALDQNALDEHADGVTGETPEFLRLNAEVARLEKTVSWWRRWLIDRRVLRELDYWERMRYPQGWRQWI